MKIGIEVSCLNQTIRGIGVYTQVLLDMLVDSETKLFTRKKNALPFSGSVQSLFRSYQGVDLIHFPEPKILYGKRPKVPFIITVHDVMPLKFPHFFPKKHTWMMRHFLPRYLRQASGIICVSETTKRDLIEFFPGLNAQVIPCALPNIDRKVSMEKDPFFIYIGSFEKRKNLKGILFAYESLKAKGCQHKLVIVGKPHGKNQLPSSLPDGVQIKGYVNEVEKRRLLEKATLLIWPSFYEGFGLPLLEAMASGAPIITSDRGSCPETVKDAALIVNPDDVEMIAKAMEKIVEDRGLRDALIKKGLDRAEDFSIESSKKKLLKFYASVKCSDIHAM